MNQGLAAGRSNFGQPNSATGASPIILTVAFAAFIFVVFTFRASINPDVSVPVLSDKRTIATLLGAGVYWLTLRAISQRLDQPIGDVLRASLRILLMGSVALMAVTAVMDVIDSVDVGVSIARNIRWLLLWLGYFATWVAGFVAHAYYLRLRAIAPSGLQSERSTGPALPSDTETAVFLLESIVDRLADKPAGERHVIAAHLLDKAGYECADSIPDAATDKAVARSAILRQVAFQLTREYRPS